MFGDTSEIFLSFHSSFGMKSLSFLSPYLILEQMTLVSKVSEVYMGQKNYILEHGFYSVSPFTLIGCGL